MEEVVARAGVLPATFALGVRIGRRNIMQHPASVHHKLLFLLYL
jgi:hypothetical protein